MFVGILKILQYLLLLMVKGTISKLSKLFISRYIDLWDLIDLEEPLIHYKAGWLIIIN